MLQKTTKVINYIASMLDKLAGISIVIAMLLVVLNVLLRKIFGKPLLGTYEFTGFITALIVGFGIAQCMVTNSHIAIDFIVEKFKNKTQKTISVIINGISFLLLSVFSYKMIEYATKLLASNELSPTTQMPYYIVVYILAGCFIILSLVTLCKTIISCQEVSA